MDFGFSNKLIPLPPLEEQLNIVHTIEKLYNYIEKASIETFSISLIKSKKCRFYLEFDAVPHKVERALAWLLFSL